MSNRGLSGVLRAAVFCTVIWALTDCGSKNSDPSATGNLPPGQGAIGETEPTFTSLYQNVFSQNCAQCHSSGGSASQQGVNLDFSSQANAYSGLLNSTVSAMDEGACAGVHLIVPGNPAASYTLAVLIQSYNQPSFGGVSGCTPQSTHLQDASLTADQQTALVSWVQQGAPNN